MNNKLFLVCPDSLVEPFIREQYGQNVLFLTALGAVFNFNEIHYVEAVDDLLQEEAVEEIFIVNDLCCRFMTSILEREKGFGTRAEQEMVDLFIENYSNIMAGLTLNDRKQKFAKLNIHRQAFELISNERLLSRISQAKISLKGLITSKTQGQLKEMNINLQEICK
ncbi:hypothetical protein DXT99_23195 [Pontibacter diazotrophicus]|uniref:Uncharacterized protein n=1 Tax=Pontibacter diazotrophicus TaxID=1400979 RepID=A0A3D8L4S7_9BACT|nr:hypothetical protein [Pontibacter diazotrophicus]RDV11932.1 hypothetical protein DXT99_23195 [Pontibacter diazotrophicus]